MKFLKEVDFTIDEIASLEENLTDAISEKITQFPALVIKNISYLKDLGVRNYKLIFRKFREIFLKDHSKFKGIFDKYETADLVDKIESNPDIVEYL